MSASERPISIDLFCGGGGGSEGLRCATGHDPDVAVSPHPMAALVEANYTEDFASSRETRAMPLLGVL